MISKLTFFESVDELKELTECTNDELWEHGFNLDDMDWGFCTSQDFGERDEDGFLDILPIDISYAYFLLSRMDEYCVGFHKVNFRGKFYYTLHHA